MAKVDYTFNHNRGAEFFDYILNFLEHDAPVDQIHEEIKRLVLDIAHASQPSVKCNAEIHGIKIIAGYTTCPSCGESLSR